MSVQDRSGVGWSGEAGTYRGKIRTVRSPHADNSSTWGPLEVEPDDVARLDRERQASAVLVPRLSISEAARQLGVSMGTVHLWVKNGTLRATRLETPGNVLCPCRWDIDSDDLPRLLHERSLSAQEHMAERQGRQGAGEQAPAGMYNAEPQFDRLRALMAEWRSQHEEHRAGTTRAAQGEDTKQ